MMLSSWAAVAGAGASDVPTLAVAGMAIVLRVLSLAGVVALRIPEIWTAVAGIAILGAYPLDYFYISGEFFPATLHLLLFLGALVFLKARSRREFFLVKICALLQLLAACLVSATLAFLALLFVFVLCAIAAQVSGEMIASLEKQPPIARAGTKGVAPRLAGVTLLAFAGIFLLGVGFFFILPRTARAALGHLISDRFRVPGFSNEVRLGEIGEIRMTRTPVMHVRVDVATPGFSNTDRPSPLKWRGSALSQFDGRRWFNPVEDVMSLAVHGGQVRLAAHDQAWRRGQRLSIEVQLKDATGDVLFFPGQPEVIRVDAPVVYRTAVGAYRVPPGMGQGGRYWAVSLLEDVSKGPYPFAYTLPEAARAGYLKLPPMDPRVAELSRNIAAGQPNDYSKAFAVEQHLRNSYRYTIELPAEAPEDPIAHFLFERKMGHCEYFASVMAVMLRAVGIPSRVATGFQSGAYNPVSGWYLVRSSDAHSWVEAFVAGYGWVSFDPTPPDPNPRGLTVWSQIGMYLDAAEVFWQEWVLSYDLERQVVLVDRMSRSSRSLSLDWIARWDWVSGLWRRGIETWTRWYSLAAILAAGAGFLGYLLLPRLWVAWKRRRRVEQLRRGGGQAADATLLYEQMLDLLSRRGVQKPSWMTPKEFAEKLPASPLVPLVAEFTDVYHRMRFGGESTMAARIVELLERMQRDVKG